jgi:hypothetical protein
MMTVMNRLSVHGSTFRNGLCGLSRQACRNSTPVHTAAPDLGVVLGGADRVRHSGNPALSPHNWLNYSDAMLPLRDSLRMSRLQEARTVSRRCICLAQYVLASLQCRGVASRVVAS